MKVKMAPANVGHQGHHKLAGGLCAGGAQTQTPGLCHREKNCCDSVLMTSGDGHKYRTGILARTQQMVKTNSHSEIPVQILPSKVGHNLK